MATDKQRKNSGRPWRKGQSGNPAGRPPSTHCLTDYLRAHLADVDPEDPEGRTYGELLARQTLALARQGHPSALREVWERIEGRVAQPIAGHDGEPLEMDNRIIVEFVAPRVIGDDQAPRAELPRVPC